jgi:urease alpha subunit
MLIAEVYLDGFREDVNRLEGEVARRGTHVYDRRAMPSTVNCNLVMRNGTIVTASDRYVADLGVRDGRINGSIAR